MRRWSAWFVLLACHLVVTTLAVDTPETLPPETENVTWDGIREVPVEIPDVKSPDYLEKLRFNYAAEQCGAKILETSGVAGGADNILSGSLDSYLLGYCNKDIWVVIELCEEISIDSIIVGNMEYFSSNFREFSIYGSKKYVL